MTALLTPLFEELGVERWEAHQSLAGASGDEQVFRFELKNGTEKQVGLASIALCPREADAIFTLIDNMLCSIRLMRGDMTEAESDLPTLVFGEQVVHPRELLRDASLKPQAWLQLKAYGELL